MQRSSTCTSANRQWSALNTTNQISTRPYIKVKLKPETFSIQRSGGGTGDLRGVKFQIQNIGRLPGLAYIQSAVAWSGRGHLADENSWPSIGVVGRVFLFPDEDAAEFTSQTLSLTSGNVADLADGDKFYVMVDVLYGPSNHLELYGPSRDYETKVCSVYRISGPANGGNEVRLSEGYPCPTDGSNSAK